MRNMTRLAVAAAIGAFFVGAPAPADAQQTINLRIGAGHPAAATWNATLREFFMPRVAERALREANVRIEWTEGWGGSVCRLGECLEAVESGLLDIGEIQTVFEPSKLQAHNFTFFAPFGHADARVGMRAVLETYDRVPQLRQILERRFNQVLVGPGMVGNYGLVTTFDWANPRDLQGKKIAAAGPNLPWIEGTGAVPVQSNLNEAYTSFQTGVYEGWIMFPDGVTGFRLNEVTRHFVRMDFGALHVPLVTMNRDTFNRLPRPVQTIITEVGREWSMHMAEVTQQRNEAAFARLQQQQGYTVRVADQATKEAWARAIANLPAVRSREIQQAGGPGDVVYTYISILQGLGHTFPRNWAGER